MIEYRIFDGFARLYNITDFDIEQTFDCGQCFRFEKSPLGGYEGVIGKYYGRIVKNDDGSIDIFGADESNIEKWLDFLALDIDYKAVKADIISHFDSEIIKKAIDYGYGIRILRQDRWEAICSFIISQNNNIPRIKKIIATLCEKYGEKFIFNGNIYYSFPTPQALIAAGEEEIFNCKTGFRAKYIIDACEKFTEGGLDFEELSSLDSEGLTRTLCTIKGVGPKVAACASLYGFARYEAFPIDVWMKKIIDKYFGGSLDISSLGSYAGIAQQYLFYYERSIS